jgi:hypothetical protein
MLTVLPTLARAAFCGVVVIVSVACAASLAKAPRRTPRYLCGLMGLAGEPQQGRVRGQGHPQ